MERILSLVVASFLLSACAESTTGSSANDAGAEDGAIGASPSYPSEGLGWRPRGARPGDVIPNVKMRGRTPDGSFTDVSMATFFDPGHRSHVLVVLVAGWAKGGLTAETTSDLVAAKIEDVVVLAVLSDAPDGSPADDDAARAFAAATGASWVLLDPKHEALGPAFDGAASPFGAMLDARTMEILHAATGAVTPADVIRSRDALY